MQATRARDSRQRVQTRLQPCTQRYVVSAPTGLNQTVDIQEIRRDEHVCPGADLALARRERNCAARVGYRRAGCRSTDECPVVIFVTVEQRIIDCLRAAIDFGEAPGEALREAAVECVELERFGRDIGTDVHVLVGVSFDQAPEIRDCAVHNDRPAVGRGQIDDRIVGAFAVDDAVGIAAGTAIAHLIDLRGTVHVDVIEHDASAFVGRDRDA